MVLFLCLSSSLAHAEKTHALAMHGVPKYAADFQHIDYANPDAPKGGELKLSVNGSFDSVNNHIILGNPAEGLEPVNDRLMARVWDEPFTLYGLVAESIDISDDRSAITFHLRPEARFHDGVPMTADDVIFSFEHFKKNGQPVRRRVYGFVDDVTKVDDHTIRFHFGAGYDRESALILAIMPVLPKHYWESRDIAKTTLEPPLGSGPYKIKSIDPGRKIVYERVADYWAKDLPVNTGLYNFDTVSYTYYRDDGISLEAFKAGDYTVRREFDVTKWKTGYDIPAVKSGDIKLEEIQHGRPEWVRAMIFNTRRPMFQDIRVRQALNLAFDFDWINKNLYYGAFRRINSYFPNSALAASGMPMGEELALLDQYKSDLPSGVFGNAWQPEEGKTPRENLLKASQLLKEAGWVVKGGSLISAASGEKFAFEILLTDSTAEKMALEFSRALKRLGIEARVRVVDSSQFTGRIDKFDYDMVIHRWINSLSPGNEQVNYWGMDAAKLNGSRNYAGISNPAIDALAKSIGQTQTRESLEARVHALDRALTWEYYIVPLQYLGRDLVAARSYLARPEITPVYGIVLETWWDNRLSFQDEFNKGK